MHLGNRAGNDLPRAALLDAKSPSYASEIVRDQERRHFIQRPLALARNITVDAVLIRASDRQLALSHRHKCMEQRRAFVAD